MENAPSDGSPTPNETNKKIKKQSHFGNFGFKSILKIADKTHTRDASKRFATRISFEFYGCGENGGLTRVRGHQDMYKGAIIKHLEEENGMLEENTILGPTVTVLTKPPKSILSRDATDDHQSLMVLPSTSGTRTVADKRK